MSKYFLNDFLEVSTTATGPFATATGLTLQFSCFNNLVTLSIPAVAAAAHASTTPAFALMTSVIPELYIPVLPVSFTSVAVSSGGVVGASPGKVIVGSDGSVGIFKSINSSSNFANAGDNGWEAVNVSWISDL